MSYKDKLCNNLVVQGGCKRKNCHFSHNTRRISKEITIFYNCHNENDYIIGKDKQGQGFYIQWSYFDNYVNLQALFSDNVLNDYRNMIFHGSYDIDSKSGVSGRYRFINIRKITMKSDNKRKKIQEVQIEPVHRPLTVDSLASWSPTLAPEPSPLPTTDAIKEEVSNITRFLNETSVEVSCIKQHFGELKKVISDQSAQIETLKKMINRIENNDSINHHSYKRRRW